MLALDRSLSSQISWLVLDGFDGTRRPGRRARRAAGIKATPILNRPITSETLLHDREASFGIWSAPDFKGQVVKSSEEAFKPEDAHKRNQNETRK